MLSLAAVSENLPSLWEFLIRMLSVCLRVSAHMCVEACTVPPCVNLCDMCYSVRALLLVFRLLSVLKVTKTLGSWQIRERWAVGGAVLSLYRWHIMALLTNKYLGTALDVAVKCKIF